MVLSRASSRLGRGSLRRRSRAPKRVVAVDRVRPGRSPPPHSLRVRICFSRSNLNRVISFLILSIRDRNLFSISIYTLDWLLMPLKALGSTRCRPEGYFLSPGATAGSSVRICARAATHSEVAGVESVGRADASVVQWLRWWWLPVASAPRRSDRGYGQWSSGGCGESCNPSH